MRFPLITVVVFRIGPAGILTAPGVEARLARMTSATTPPCRQVSIRCKARIIPGLVSIAGTCVPQQTEPRPFQTTQPRSEEHTSELQSPCNLVCRLLLEKKKKTK